MAEPYGFCQCGCGQRTRLASRNHKGKGWIQGQPLKFIHNHSGRVVSPFRKGHTYGRLLKGIPKTPEHRAALSKALTGKSRLPSHREAQRQAWARKSYEERLAASAPGRRAANPGKHRGAHNPKWWAALTDVQRADIIARRKGKQRHFWACLTHDEKLQITGPGCASGTRAARLAKPSSIERIVASILDVLGVAYLKEQRIGRYLVDFLIPSHLLVIECDGTYWHSLPHVKERDARRDLWLQSYGYSVLRLPETEIRNGLIADALAILKGA